MYEDEPIEDDSDLSDPFGKIDSINTIKNSIANLEACNNGILNYLSQFLDDDHRCLLEKISTSR